VVLTLGSTSVAEIPNIESLRLKGKAEEIDRGRIAVGQDVRVILDPFPEKTYRGKLDRISPLTEQSWEWPPTRSFRAFATLGEADSRLRPQMNGRMDIIIDRLPDSISVPTKAVFARDGKPVVLVPDNEGVRPVNVEVLARNPDEVAVRGIDAGTQVALIDTSKGGVDKDEKGSAAK
jgi:multidrug efflux pump subunit AcrA (membrane-fusion protein)